MTHAAELHDFEYFVATRWGSLVRTAYLLAGQRDEAEDFVQNALARTYLRWERFESLEEAEVHARTLVTRTALRAGRRRRHGDELVPAPIDPGPDAGGRDGLELAERVARALALLTPEQRAVIVLRYWEQLSEAEIARAMRCSRGTVKSRSARAVAALRATGLLAESTRTFEVRESVERRR
jgi:RNA polymerase sigma-70 factor (sigma-E family)